jgi:hypothetical protein
MELERKKYTDLLDSPREMQAIQKTPSYVRQIEEKVCHGNCISRLWPWIQVTVTLL